MVRRQKVFRLCSSIWRPTFQRASIRPEALPIVWQSFLDRIEFDYCILNCVFLIVYCHLSDNLHYLSTILETTDSKKSLVFRGARQNWARPTVSLCFVPIEIETYII